MTADELKASLESTLGQFRAANDAALEEAKKHGKTSAETAAKVDTINSAVTDLKDQLTKLSNATSEKLAAISVSGGGAGGPTVAQKAKNLASFRSATKKPHASADEMDAYVEAFHAFMRLGEKNALTPAMQNAMSVGYEQGGGYWVPPDTSGPMQKKLYDTSPMRQVCTVVTISSDALEGMVDNDEVATGWVAEQQARPETKTPTVGRYRIDVCEQYANPRITQQLLDDSQYDVEGWLRDKVADKMARTENDAFINGNGSGKPRGILNYTFVATDDKTRKWDQIQYIASGAAGSFLTTGTPPAPMDPVLDLIYSLKAGYRTGASFLGSRPTIGTMRKFKDGQGNYLSSFVFNNGVFIETLAGYPMVEADDMPAIAANSIPLLFGNFKSAYIIVDRQGIRVLVDPYTAKPYVQFYTTKRVGGGLVNGEAVKGLKIAVT